VKGDGSVTLDCIAKGIDVSASPAVTSGNKTAKEVYMKFMGLWDTDKPDDVVSF